jgi:hypothetical protein
MNISTTACSFVRHYTHLRKSLTQIARARVDVFRLGRQNINQGGKEKKNGLQSVEITNDTSNLLQAGLFGRRRIGDRLTQLHHRLLVLQNSNQ